MGQPESKTSLQDLLDGGNGLIERIRAIVRDELSKVAAEEAVGKPYYIVTPEDVAELNELLRLGPWQKDRIGFWLDHLRTSRGELIERPELEEPSDG